MARPCPRREPARAIRASIRRSAATSARRAQGRPAPPQQDDEVLSVPAVVDAVAGASVDPQLEYALADSAVVPETAQLDTVETRLDTGADPGRRPSTRRTVRPRRCPGAGGTRRQPSPARPAVAGYGISPRSRYGLPEPRHCIEKPRCTVVSFTLLAGNPWATNPPTAVGTAHWHLHLSTLTPAGFVPT